MIAEGDKVVFVEASYQTVTQMEQAGSYLKLASAAVGY
jgi:hypothetical protein